MRPLSSCVRPPSVNEFIRSPEGVWYQVGAIETTMVRMKKVLVSPKDTAAADKDKAAAEKDEAAAEKDEAAAAEKDAAAPSRGKTAPAPSAAPSAAPAKAPISLSDRFKNIRIELVQPRHIVQDEVLVIDNYTYTSNIARIRTYRIRTHMRVYKLVLLVVSFVRIRATLFVYVQHCSYTSISYTHTYARIQTDPVICRFWSEDIVPTGAKSTRCPT